VSATDGNGAPVIGLTKDQFSILDTSQTVQPLQVFKDFPLHLGIVLMASPATFSQQQAAAIDLVQKTIRPDVDEAFVVSAHGKKPWQSERLDWAHNPADLTKIIRGLDQNAGLIDAFNFDMKTDEAGTDEDAGRSTLQTFGGGGVTVFDVVYSMMSSDPRPSRRVLVIFREPWSHSPGFGNRANVAVERQMSRVIAAAQEMHVSTFVIGLEDPKYNGITDTNIGKNYISLHAGDDGGAGSSNREFDRQMQTERNHAYDAGKTNIQRIASETGGTTYWSRKKNYSDAINSIASQLAGQYVVIFTPSDVPGPVHTLKVTSASGAHLLAQTSFFYGQ
jgi:VWFA-related protein